MQRSEDMEREAIAQAATAWHVRMNDPGASVADRAAFQRWHAADPRHEAALAEIGTLWADVRPAVAAMGRSGWHRERPVQVARRRVAGAAIAMAAAMLVAVGIALWRDPGLTDRMLADVSTVPGQRQVVTLADGSRLELDGDTAVDVAAAGTVRELRLRRGRIFIDVARDESRPFRAFAGEGVVEVLGTAFAVERREAGFGVVVEHGAVAVAHADDRVTLRAGEAVEAAAGRPLQARPAGPVAFAWRQGLLVFDRTPLAEVAVALQRAGSGPIVLADAAVGQLSFSGVFQADRPDAVLAALNPALGLKAVAIPGLGTLLRR